MIRHTLGMRALGAGALAILLGGCGGGGSGPLVAPGGFEGPPGAKLTGRRIPPGRVKRVPAFRVQGAEGSPLSYRVRLRNDDGGAVTVTGVRDDPDLDGQFVVTGMQDGPVRIAPGSTAFVGVRGRLGRCEKRAAGQLTVTTQERFAYRAGGDEGVQQVDLPAIIEVESPPDADCPGR